MVKAETKSGFKFEFDERIVRDQGFLDACLSIRKATDNMVKLEATQKMYLMVLGKKGYKALEEHIRKQNDGFCDSEVFANEFGEILDSTKDLKK